MRKIGLVIGCICFFSLSGLGQTIQLVDPENKPISDVFIYHDQRSYTAFTDKKGEADLSSFPKQGVIHFQHPSFKDVHASFDSLQTMSFRLSLVQREVWFNELVVSANKWEQEERDLSQSVLSVSRKEIAFNNPTTSADLLTQSGQVFVQKSQLGGGSPKLRGFSTNAVLLVIDGVRMNNAIYRSGNLQNVLNIDPNTIETSEVIFGPGSVIYGSDALGGVMDFHTVSPRWSADETEISGNVLIRYSSAANERTAHVDLSVRKKKLTYFGSVTRTLMDDLRAGANRNEKYEGYFLRPTYVQRRNNEDILVQNDDPNVQVGSGYNFTSTVHKLKFLVTPKMDMSYNFYYSTTSDIPRYDRLAITSSPTIDSLVYGDWYYGPQTWEMHSIQLNGYQSTKLFDQVRLTLAYQDYEESRKDRDFGDDWLRTRSEQVGIYSANLDFDKKIKNGDLFYGAEMVRNDVESEGLRRNLLTNEISPTSTRYPDEGSKYFSTASYLSMIYKFNPKWTLNLGARYNIVHLKARNSGDNSDISSFNKINIWNGALNGMAGLIHLPSDQSKIGLTFSTGFRSPNVDDVGKLFEFDNDENGQPIILVPNENLKPEYAYNSELSWNQRIGKLTVGIVGFYTILKNPIVRGPFTVDNSSTIQIDDDNDSSTPDVTHGIVAQVNGDQAKIYGASFQAKVTFNENLISYGTLSFSDGEETSTGEPLRHTTPVFGKMGIRWGTEKTGFEVYSEFNGNRWRDEIPTSEIEDKPYLYTPDGSPGWITLNFKSSHNIGKHLTATLGIENIFDTHYRPYSSGISAPGRNFIIGLRGRF